GIYSWLRIGIFKL
ncbi:transketolase, pyrimidine binding domain protein, partial [Chlamydia psittaci 84-8471/1]